ncbi:MAG: ATP-binding protein [Acidobacteriota bacterium]
MLRQAFIAAGRRPWLVGLGFGLFILFDIALFIWLIFDSLSQREVEEAILRTRQDAAPIAAGLEAQAEAKGSEDLYVLVSVAEETKTYIDSVLASRQLVSRVEIRDRDGKVVLHKRDEEQLPLEEVDVPRLAFDEAPEAKLLETHIPIGENLGTLVVGVDETEVQRRIQILRRDLIRQASIFGGFSVTLLVVGLVAFLRLQRRARRLEDQAQQAERMAYVGTLASGLAHEIRSPLNSLNLNMQMLEEEAREDKRSGSQRRLLSITRSELKRLENLATDFLAYAKPQPLVLEEVPIVDLLERARAVMDGALREKGVAVSIEDLSGGEAVEVDRGQINQLLLNLIHNAIDATDKTKRLPRLRLVASFKDDRPILEVVDNGEGIDEEARRQIFDVFYSQRKGGTGLGLAIVQRIAESHGARLEVESEPGKGTCLRVVFKGTATDPGG